MARKIKSRLRITGTLAAETPLHIGGYGDSPDTDLPLALNGKGDWYAPGTSIAGVLRSWCEKHFGHVEIEKDKSLVKDIFGFQDGDKGQASFMLIEDAIVTLPEGLTIENRDGVGIDRFYGTAADKAKFDRAILPRGTKLDFGMTVEIGDDHSSKRSKAVVRYILEALTKSRIRFGGAKTRGFGRVKLKNCKVKEEDFNDFDAMIRLLKDENAAKPFATWLAEFESSLSEAEKKEFKGLKAEQPQLLVEISWRPRLPVMVKAGYDGIGVDILPLTSGVDNDKLALCLPGSSIKGVLRSQAERIMRTMLGDCNRTRGEKFNDQIDSIPLVEELFGSRGKATGETENDRNNKRCRSNPKAKLGLGALTIDDCYSKETMNAELWRKVEVARDDKPKEKAKKSDQDQKEYRNERGEVSYFKRELWKYLREIDEGSSDLSDVDYAKETDRFKIDHHVAIDRWTGGASEGALYSVLAPENVHWEPMHLTLDFNRLSGHSQLPALMLLLLTLRDVAEDRLPFGFATNRGMGEILVDKIRIEGGALNVSLKPLENFETDGKFVELHATLKDKLRTEWESWLKTNQIS